MAPPPPGRASPWPGRSAPIPACRAAPGGRAACAGLPELGQFWTRTPSGSCCPPPPGGARATSASPSLPGRGGWVSIRVPLAGGGLQGAAPSLGRWRPGPEPLARPTSSKMLFLKSSSSCRLWQRFSRSTRRSVSFSSCCLATAWASSDWGEAGGKRQPGVLERPAPLPGRLSSLGQAGERLTPPPPPAREHLQPWRGLPWPVQTSPPPQAERRAPDAPSGRPLEPAGNRSGPRQLPIAQGNTLPPHPSEYQLSPPCPSGCPAGEGTKWGGSHITNPGFR